MNQEKMPEKVKEEIAISQRVNKIYKNFKKKVFRILIPIIIIALLLTLSLLTGIAYIFLLERAELKKVIHDAKLTRAIIESIANLHEEKLIMIQVIDEEAKFPDGTEKLTPQQKVGIVEVIQEAIQRYKKDCPPLTPSFVFGIIKQESNWNPRIVSFYLSRPVAYGLMQIRWPTALICADLMRYQGIDDIRLTSSEDLFDPVINVKIGIFYYVYLYKIYKDKKYALYSYYAGEYWTDKIRKKAKVTVWGFGHCDIVEAYQKQYQARGIL